MTLGEKIKKLRTEKGISQEELGRLMDVHYTHVSRYERNQSTPSMEALKKLARVFKVSADYLLFDDVEKMAMGDIHDSDLLHQPKFAGCGHILVQYRKFYHAISCS